MDELGIGEKMERNSLNPPPGASIADHLKKEGKTRSEDVLRGRGTDRKSVRRRVVEKEAIGREVSARRRGRCAERLRKMRGKRAKISLQRGEEKGGEVGVLEGGVKSRETHRMRTALQRGKRSKEFNKHEEERL